MGCSDCDEEEEPHLNAAAASAAAYLIASVPTLPGGATRPMSPVKSMLVPAAVKSMLVPAAVIGADG